jgi:hypothetical protein
LVINGIGDVSARLSRLAAEIAEISRFAFFPEQGNGCYFDKDANVYVSDWNRSGRVTKLVRVMSSAPAKV